MYKIIIVILAIFISFFSFNQSLFAIDLGQLSADYQSRITQYQLDNGMRFLILEDKSAPVVTFCVQVRAGSVYENLQETGMNHLIEHLAFSGTKRIGTKNWEKEKVLLEELDRLRLEITQAKEADISKDQILDLNKKFEKVRKQAAELAEPNQFAVILDQQGAVGPNAFVSNDFTVYWVELPANQFELWACLESERLFNSVFRLFYEEIEIVKEERRTVVDNSPTGRLMEEFRALAYQVHPYRNPILGYQSDIQTMNRARVIDLYREYYLPSNILVSIVGDVCAEEIKPILDKYFGKIPSQKNPDFNLPQEPKRSVEKRVYIQMESQPILLIGFNIPSIQHPDIPALKVASQVIGEARTSRLYRRLVNKEQSAVTVSTRAWTPRYPGLFYIWAIAAEGYTNQDIEPIIYQEIEKLSNKLLPLDQIEAAQARLTMEFIQTLKSRRNLALELAWFEEVTGSWKNFFKMHDLIFEVSPEDIQNVVNRYFIPGNRTVGIVEPLEK